MSIESVKAFYERLSEDEAFRTQIENVNSKEECSAIVKAAGYDFTLEEYEEYTAELLEASATEEMPLDLDEEELEAVLGGGKKIFGPPYIQPMYGVVLDPPVQALYGVIRPPVDDCPWK